MRLESCARQFSICTIALTGRWIRGPVETHERGKFVESVDAEHSRQASSSAGTRSSGFALAAPCFAMKLNDFANRHATISVLALPEEENLLHRTFREHACDAISSRLARLARTNTDLECVTKWVDILDSTPDLIHVHWFHVLPPASHNCTLLSHTYPASFRASTGFLHSN